MKTVKWTKNALNKLHSIPKNDANRIVSKVQNYTENPNNTNQVKKLVGGGGYRLRVGQWRILFDDDGTVMEIYYIASRGSVYKP